MEWTCPYSGLPYRGNCPVVRCPANLSGVEERPSGCFHQFMENKTEFGVHEIAYAFGGRSKHVEREIELGKRRLEKVVVLQHLLQHVRKFNHHHCQKCGIVRLTSGDCLNPSRCQERAAYWQRISTRRPFSIPELKFTSQDFYRILHEQAALRPFVKKFNKKLGVKSLLRLPRDFTIQTCL